MNVGELSDLELGLVVAIVFLIIGVVLGAFVLSRWGFV